MESSLLACPICTQPGFMNLESLCRGLIYASTREFVCPECSELLRGLDKFTIHLFSHSISLQNPRKDVQLTNSEDTTKSTDLQRQGTKNPVCVFKTFSDFHISPHYDNYVASCRDENGDPTPKPPHDLQDIVPSNVSICKNPVNHHNSINQNSHPNEGENNSMQVTRSFKFTGIDRGDGQLNPTNVQTRTENIYDTPATEFAVNTTILPNKTPDPPKVLENLKEKSALICEVCRFSFTDDAVLDMHKQLIHSAASTETYNRENDIVDTNIGKSHACLLCAKSFRMRGSLMVHMRVAHNGLHSGKLKSSQIEGNIHEDRSYTCNICDKIFKKENHLTQHMKTHDGKQWSCDVCSKLFTTKYFLKKHKRLHTGEMPYRCGICDKTFTFQQSYHKHLLYHSDEKPHVCSECDRAFKELSTLHNHQRIHTGEKPFACETCGKCFRQRVSYLVHRRIHTGVMPYRCTACGKNFRYKVSQRTHRCPSQPPGTVVRQSSELVQKLRQAVADKPQQLDQSAVNDSGPSLNIGKESVISEKQLSPQKQQQTTETHQNNQYIFVTNSHIQSLPQNIVISSPPVVWITAKSEKSYTKEANQEMLEKGKLTNATSSQINNCLGECCNVTSSVNCRESLSEGNGIVNEQGFIYICKDNINYNNENKIKLDKSLEMSNGILKCESGTCQNSGAFYSTTESSDILNLVMPSFSQSDGMNSFCEANEPKVPVTLSIPVVVQNNIETNFSQEKETFSTEYILGKSNLKCESDLYNSNTVSSSHTFAHQSESIPVGQSKNLEQSQSLLVLNEESLNLFYDCNM